MQKINSIIIVILALAVGYLMVDKFTSKDNDSPEVKETTRSSNVDQENTESLDSHGKIAYVDLDTLNSKFVFLLDKLDLMKSEQMREKKNFERKAQGANERYLSLQEQAYSMTPDQIEAAGVEMENAQRELQDAQDKIADRLLALESSIQTELDVRIDRHLDSLNVIYGYDYILAKAAGSGVLTANEAYNITDEVLKGLNDEYEAEKKKAAK